MSESRTCLLCWAEFEVTDSDRLWYADQAARRGWDGDPTPKRCPSCRRARRAARKRADEEARRKLERTDEEARRNPDEEVTRDVPDVPGGEVDR